jgi:hypothetical protein
MRTFLTLVFLAVLKTTFGQFALIQDPDGFANVRDSSWINSKTIDKLENGHLVWCYETQGNWLYVDYKVKGEGRGGFIYEDRVTQINSFDSIPIIKLGKNKVILKKDSLKISITAKEFIPNKSRLTYEDQNDGHFLAKINGKPYWGTDGDVPNLQYGDVSIQHGKRTFTIPPEKLNDLFQPNLDKTVCFFDRKQDIIYLSSTNSDGAGSYVVLWVLKAGFFRERFVTNPF